MVSLSESCCCQNSLTQRCLWRGTGKNLSPRIRGRGGEGREGGRAGRGRPETERYTCPKTTLQTVARMIPHQTSSGAVVLFVSCTLGLSGCGGGAQSRDCAQTTRSIWRESKTQRNFLFQCCFTSTKPVRLIRDGEPRAVWAISTFTQLLSSDSETTVRVLTYQQSASSHSSRCQSRQVCLLLL